MKYTMMLTAGSGCLLLHRKPMKGRIQEKTGWGDIKRIIWRNEMELLLGVIEIVLSVIVGVLYICITALAFFVMTALVILVSKGLMEKLEEE